MANRRPSPASTHFTRRDFVGGIAAAAVAAAAPALAADDATVAAAPAAAGTGAARNGRIQQSACRWCYNNVELDKLAAEGKKMGLVGIDLLSPK